MSAVNFEGMVAEARKKLEEMFRNYISEIEEEANRILSERLRQIKPIKEEIIRSLRIP